MFRNLKNILKKQAIVITIPNKKPENLTEKINSSIISIGNTIKAQAESVNHLQ